MGNDLGRYHLFRRKYTDKKTGKEKVYWWYHWTEDGKRHQAPAGRACELKRDARDFILRLIDDEVRAAEETQKKALEASAVRFRDYAATLFVPGSRYLRRLTETAEELKLSTVNAHQGRVENYLIPAWGDCQFSRFEEEGFEADFQDWLLDLSRAPIVYPHKRPSLQPIQAAPEPREISNSLRNNLDDTMTLIIKEAKRDRLIRSVPKFERFLRKSRRQDILTDQEFFYYSRTQKASWKPYGRAMTLVMSYIAGLC